MAVFLSLAVIVLVLILVKYALKGKRHLKGTPPPSPPGLPIIGNAHQVNINYFHLAVEKWKKKYGDIFSLNILGKEILFINSSETIREAFASPEFADMFADRPPMFPNLFVLPQDIIFHSYTPKVAKLRKLLHKTIKLFGRDASNVEAALKQELSNLIDRLQKKTNTSFDIFDDLSLFVGNIIIILLTGKGRSADDRMMHLVSRIDENLDCLANPGNSAVMELLPLIRFLPGKPGRAYRELIKDMEELIATLREEYKQGLCGEDTLVAKLLDGTVKLEGEKSPNSEDIKGVLIDLIAAGVETTKHSINSLILFLVHHQDVQKKIQKEVDKIISEEGSVEFRHKGKLQYTEAAMLEHSRMHTPLPMSVPHATRDDVVFHGYFIPKGTFVLYNMWDVHHDEDFWERSWEYDPSRFLDKDGSLLPADNEKRRRVIPFGIGRRVCPGEALSRMRTFLFVTKLLQHFDVLPDEANPPPPADSRQYNTGIVLYPKQFKLILRPRDSASVRSPA